MNIVNRTFKILPLAACIATAWTAHAQQVAYSPSMLRALVSDGQEIDTSFFQKGFDIQPGTYHFVMNLNGDRHKASMYEVREHHGSLELVLRVMDLRALPLKNEVLEKLATFKDEEEVFPLSSVLDGAFTEVDTNKMVVNLSIPQIYLSEESDWVDIAPRKDWDYGETGAVINYNLTGSHQDSRVSDTTSSNLYLNLNGRFNFGAWRLYTSGGYSVYRSNYSGEKQTSSQWDLWNTYLQRDLPDINGTLALGELTTSSDLFDSVPIRGINVSTNVEMLPYRDRTYAPIIEGIANTNAQVIIRQNGHVVHTVNVAPGPFRLENLPNFGNYGDLEVVIREADGSERILNIPYSSVSNMLREGQYRYDFNIGRYYRKNSSANEDTSVIMGTLSYGLPNDITVYGGTQFAEGYYALALGAGLSLGKYGALSADVIQSKNKSDSNRYMKEGSGTAWRMRYEKTLTQTGTTVNLANYQYRTGNYMTLEDYVNYGTSQSNFWLSHGRIRSRWQLSMSQNLANYGSLGFSADYAKYHGTSSDVKTFSASYGTSIKGIGTSLSYSRNYVKVGRNDAKHWNSSHTLMLNLNIPLSLFSRHSASSIFDNTYVGYTGQVQEGMNGERTYSQSVVMNSSSTDGKWNWYASQELGSRNDRATSASLGYNGDRANVNVGYDHSHTTNGYQLGFDGALVFHRTGITATKSTFGPIAMIEVPDASGVKVFNSFDTSTDVFGNAVLSYLSTYTKNRIELDPATLPEGAILLDGSEKYVVPTQDSITRVKFPVRFGKQAVFILKYEDGRPLPFGATVKLLGENGEADPYVMGMIGEGGRVFLSGLPENGELTVLDSNKISRFNYQLPVQDLKNTEDFANVPAITIYQNN